MALFVIVALKGSGAAVDEAVKVAYPTESYQAESGTWIVNADSVIAKQVSDKLGITDKPVSPASMQALVVSINGYYGRAQADLWEWISAKSVKANV
jgi:hypothetical protein